MRKESVSQWIEGHPEEERDVIVYQYGDPRRFILAMDGMRGRCAYDGDGKRRITDAETLGMAWQRNYILCEYRQNGCIFLQVNYK